jgi:hypothetical protein
MGGLVCQRGPTGRPICTVRDSVKHACKTLRRTFRVPSAEDDPSVRRVMSDLVNHLLELIDPLARIIVLARPVLRPEMPPLEPIHGSQVAFASMAQPDFIKVLSRPIALPYIHPFGRERLAVGIARDEPEQLFDDAAGEDAFRSQEGERPVRQGEA